MREGLKEGLRTGRAVAVGAALPALLALLYFWLRDQTTDSLRDELTKLHGPYLMATTLLLIASTACCLPPLIRRLERGQRPLVASAVSMLVALSAFAFVLTTFVAPRTSRIFYDEQIYQSIGQNLADEGRAMMCNEGIVTRRHGRPHLECERGEYNKQPYGYPFLLSLGYRLFGVSDTLAHRFNNLCHALLVWVTFALTALLFEDRRAALFAAGIVAVVPQSLLWSNTAAAEPVAALSLALAVLAVVLFCQQPATWTLLWATSSAALAVQIRPESILLLPLILLALLLLAPGELGQERVWWGAVIGLVLLVPLLGHQWAVRGEGWGTTGPRLSLQYLPGNLSINGPFFFNNEEFPVAFTVLAGLGLASLRRLRPLSLVTAYFLAFWGIFLVFYAGSYHYGADVRYSLLSYPPIAVLAGFGASRLLAAVRRLSLPAALERFLDPLLALGLLLAWLPFLPLVRTVGEEAWAARADVEVARRWSAELPEDSVVLTHNPNMFLVWGQSAAQASLATYEPKHVQEELTERFPGGVFFHWNFWCNLDDPVQQPFCDRILDEMPHELWRQETVRDFRFALYHLRFGTHSVD